MRAPSRIIMSGYCLGEDDDGLQNAEVGFGVVNTQHARSLRGLWTVSSYDKRIQLFSQNLGMPISIIFFQNITAKVGRLK